MADKHMLLTFLSDYKPNAKNNQIIPLIKYITSLGEISGYNSSEPAVKYVVQSIKDKANLDKIFVFTSKAMNREITYKLNEKDNEHKGSHYSLFKQNLQNEYQNFNDNSFEKTDFNEIDNATDNNYNAFSELVSSATSMADKIIAFKRESGCDIVIHVDLTGGLRIAAFLISTVVQLLEHQKGITIKDYIYSQFFGIGKPGKIFNASEIVQSSSLAAGAEAFVKYGSTEVLEDYFRGKDKDIPNLRPLLDSMREFAEALQICSAGLLPDKIAELKKQIEEFESKAADFKKYELLFNVFIEKIKEKYEKLFAEIDDHKKNLNIIEWCVENHYIQQAITLATEWIPAVLVSNQIFYPTDAEKVNQEHENSTHTYDPVEKYFMISYLYEKNESGYKRFKRLFLKGEAKTELDKEEAINICAEYKNITKLRNDINHINYKAGIEKVESSIKKAIENIKMIIAKVNNGTPAEKETPFVSNIDNCNVSHKAEQKITKSSEYKHNSNGRIDRPKKLKKENKAINPIQKISSDIKMYFIELSKGNDISGEFFTEMSKFSETDAENLKNFISAIQKEGWAKAISNGDYSERLCQLLFSIKQKHTQFSSVWLDNSFESFKLFLTKKFNEDKFYKLLNSLSNKEIKAIFLPNLK